jgi:hypothetical protein
MNSDKIMTNSVTPDTVTNESVPYQLLWNQAVVRFSHCMMDHNNSEIFQWHPDDASDDSSESTGWWCITDVEKGNSMVGDIMLHECFMKKRKVVADSV